MADFHALWRRLTEYAAADDPLTAASNKLALILASNQPFYPLYVWWFMGEADPIIALTFLSTPFFLAAPWIAKRYPGIGRLWFPTVGAINTYFCAFLFGGESGVEFFLAPCVVIALLSCRTTERLPIAIYIAALLAAFALLHGRYDPPLYTTEAGKLASLQSLNGYSAAILCVVAIWMLGRSRSEHFIIR